MATDMADSTNASSGPHPSVARSHGCVAGIRPGRTWRHRLRGDRWLGFATGKQSTQCRYDLNSLLPGRRYPPAGDNRGRPLVDRERHCVRLGREFAEDPARVRNDHGPANLTAVERDILGLVERSVPKANRR